MSSAIHHFVCVGDPQDPTVFELKQTPVRLEGWSNNSTPVFLVQRYSVNDLDPRDPVIWYEAEFDTYEQALVEFSRELHEHAQFLAEYHSEEVSA